MKEISLAGILSPTRITYYMEKSYTGVTRNNPIHTKAVTMHKQDQCIKLC